MRSVWVKRGVCSADSLINIALFILGYLPGLLHAWYIIFTYPDEYESISQNDPEYRGHVTYYYVQGGSAPARQQSPHPHPQPGQYGTVSSQPGAQFPGQQTGTTNSFPSPQQPQQPYQTPQQPQPQSQAQSGSSSRPQDVPPSYADAVKGDNKVQSHD